MDEGGDHPVAGGAPGAPPGGPLAGMELSGGVPFGHAPPGPPSGGVPFKSAASGGAPAGGVPLGRKPAGGSPSGRVPFGANPCSGFSSGGCISVLFPADDGPLAVGVDPWGATVAGLDSLDGLSVQPAMQMQQASSPPTAMANRAARRFLLLPGVIVFIISLSWIPNQGRRASSALSSLPVVPVRRLTLLSCSLPIGLSLFSGRCFTSSSGSVGSFRERMSGEDGPAVPRLPVW